MIASDCGLIAHLLEEDLGDLLRRPRQLVQPRRDLTVEIVQPLGEETSFLREERLQDSVVPAHDEHHILTQAAVPVAIR